MKFNYRQVPLSRPALALGGRLTRPRSLLTVTLLNAGLFDVQDGLLDTGADDTVFTAHFNQPALPAGAR